MNPCRPPDAAPRISVGRISFLALLSLVLSVPGLAYIYRSVHIGRPLFQVEFYICLIAGPFLAYALGNRLLKSQSKVHQAELARARAISAIDPKLRLKWGRRQQALSAISHPGRFLLELLAGCILGPAFLIAGLSARFQSFADLGQSWYGHPVVFAFFGAFFSLITIPTFAEYFLIMIRGRWQSHWDSVLQKLDSEIKQLELDNPSQSEQNP